MKKQSFKENYEIVKKIGSGLTAEVYEAKSKSHGRVSIKIVQPSFYNSKIGSQLIQNEVKILSQLDHKNVLKLIQKAQLNSKIHIVTEFCQGGDLQNYIRKNKTISQKQTLAISKSITEGLIYLKQKQVVHRDLKPSNIFLKGSQPIIADFGFAVQTNNRSLMSINAGSPLYMSYESLVNKKFSEKSDVFSLGVCMFEMLTGKTPWSAKSESQLIHKLKTPPKMPSQIGQKLGKVILKCLLIESSQRPHLEQILKSILAIIGKDSNTVCEVRQKQNQFSQKSSQFKVNKSISMHVDMKKIGKNMKENNKQNIVIQCNKKVRSTTINQQKNIEKETKRVPLTSRPHTQFLNSLNPDQFTFLPPSVISKFKLILHNYKKVIQPTKQNSLPPIIVEQKDSLVLDMQKCKTEVQLCQCIESFIRRLFRLTKNYKQHKNCLSSLQNLYERVTKVVI